MTFDGKRPPIPFLGTAGMEVIVTKQCALFSTTGETNYLDVKIVILLAKQKLN